MPKTLTKLQERIIARVLAEPAQTLCLREGDVNSTNNMIEKGLIDRHPYSMLQHHHLTHEVKSLFFQRKRRSLRDRGHLRQLLDQLRGP
jgi:hypothetical protein